MKKPNVFVRRRAVPKDHALLEQRRHKAPLGIIGMDIPDHNRRCRIKGGTGAGCALQKSGRVVAAGR